MRKKFHAINCWHFINTCLRHVKPLLMTQDLLNKIRKMIFTFGNSSISRPFKLLDLSMARAQMKLNLCPIRLWFITEWERLAFNTKKNCKLYPSSVQKFGKFDPYTNNHKFYIPTYVPRAFTKDLWNKKPCSCVRLKPCFLATIELS